MNCIESNSSSSVASKPLSDHKLKNFTTFRTEFRNNISYKTM